MFKKNFMGNYKNIQLREKLKEWIEIFIEK